MYLDSQKLLRTLHQIVTMLVEKDYQTLESLSNGIRLTALEIETAIKEYSRTIVMPPENVFKNIDIIEVNGSKPKQWSVYFNLWTVEEGQSDLALELTLIDSDKQTYEVQLDDIHVL